MSSAQRIGMIARSSVPHFSNPIGALPAPTMEIPGVWSCAKGNVQPSARAVEDQISAFATLVRPFERAIYLVALAFTSEAEDAVEVAQAAVARAFGSFSSLRQFEQLQSWLIGIAVNEATAFLRRKHMDCDDIFLVESDHLDDISYSFTQVGCIAGTATLEMRGTVSEALKALPLKYRVVAMLRDVLHLATSDTAKILSVPAETVRARLARARFGLLMSLAQATV
jgi:RNA polymerase sigma-70 factor, ECF subfamily